jgi:hypothetical protein
VVLSRVSFLGVVLDLGSCVSIISWKVISSVMGADAVDLPHAQGVIQSSVAKVALRLNDVISPYLSGSASSYTGSPLHLGEK